MTEEFKKQIETEARQAVTELLAQAKLKKGDVFVVGCSSSEIVGGATTFLAMAYIVAVNPGILAAAGIPFSAALTSTCLGAALMTVAMGLIANRPIALASGMGLNAVVAYSLCLGEVGVDWRVAMAVVLVEGIVILILVLCGLRKAIMDAIPVDLRRAIGIGIGLFGLCGLVCAWEACGKETE